MYHLFNRTYIRPLSELEDHLDKMVVGHSVTEEFIDHRDALVGRVLNLAGMSHTLHYSNQVDQFVHEEFPARLPSLIASERPLRLYLDEDAHQKLLALWVMHVFKDLSFEHFTELFRIHHLDALSTRRAQSPYYPHADILKALYIHTPKLPELTECLVSHHDCLSLEYRLYASHLGGEVKGPATTIRRFFYQECDLLTHELYRELPTLLHTDALRQSVEVDEGLLRHGHDPLACIKGLRFVNQEQSFVERLQQAESKRQLVEDLHHDFNVIGRLTVNMDPSQFTLEEGPFQMVLEDDDSVLVSEYTRQVVYGRSPTSLVPATNFGDISINLISWLTRQGDNGPRLCWQ